jgi:hypothetical protein
MRIELVVATPQRIAVERASDASASTVAVA